MTAVIAVLHLHKVSWVSREAIFKDHQLSESAKTLAEFRDLPTWVYVGASRTVWKHLQIHRFYSQLT